MGNSGGLPIAADPDKITDEKTKELITSFNSVALLEKKTPSASTGLADLHLLRRAELRVAGAGQRHRRREDVLKQLESNYNKGVEAAGVKS